MRSLFLTLLLIGLTIPSYASDVQAVYVERKNFNETLGELVLPVAFDSKGYTSSEVWRSPKGIVCTVLLVQQSNTGSFECVSPEKYKAQVALDCSLNSSRETAVYLFFGQVGDENEVSNFHVWCE